MMESPYFALLEAKRLPSSEELVQIKGFLATFHHQEKQIDTEIEVVQGQLNTLLEKKKRLTDFIGQHAPLVSPIMHVPPDILREIFYHCMPPLISAGWMSSRHCPVLLTHVCSSWRKFAFNTPLLWTSLHMYIPPRLRPAHRPVVDTSSIRVEFQTNLTQTVNAQLDGAEEWLKRSRGLPLHVSINHLEISGSQSTQPIADEAISPFLTTASRWKSLCFKHNSRSLFPLSRFSPSTAFVSLESLFITASQGNVNTAPSTVDPTPIHAPRLKTLALRFGADLGMYSFPWSQLENLHLVVTPSTVSPSSPSRAIFSILESCSSLLNLQLHGLNTHDPASGVMAAAPTQSIITLPQLTTLSVTQFSLMDSRFFPRLKVPRLKNLHCECAYSGDRNTSVSNNEGIPIYQFIQAANPLHTLAIDPEALKPSLFLSLLKMCSSLKELHLTRPGLPHPIQKNPWQTSRTVETRFLQLLSGQVENETICPGVEEFTCHDGITCSESDVLAFLVSKQSGALGVAPLRRLCLRFTVLGPSNPSIFAKIEQFRLEPKIQLYFTYSSKNPWQSLLSDSSTIHTNDRAARWFFDCVSDGKSTGFGLF